MAIDKKESWRLALAEDVLKTVDVTSESDCRYFHYPCSDSQYATYDRELKKIIGISYVGYENGEKVIKNIDIIKFLEYDEISLRFRNGNKIKSLKDGVIREYSGFLSLSGIGADAIGYDSFNKDLVVYEKGVLAEVVEQGIDKYAEHERHIINVLKTSQRLGCTTSDLLKMDYMKELDVTKNMK